MYTFRKGIHFSIVNDEFYHLISRFVEYDETSGSSTATLYALHVKKQSKESASPCTH